MACIVTYLGKSAYELTMELKSFDMAMTKIMIIDDNKTHLVLSEGRFGRIFEKEEVLTFDSPKQALEELSKDVDGEYLIFLDLYMPEVDGWQFLEQYEGLSRKEKDKFYMLSAAVDQSSIEKARNHSLLDGFISKPLTFHAIDSVRKHVLKAATV